MVHKHNIQVDLRVWSGFTRQTGPRMFLSILRDSPRIAAFHFLTCSFGSGPVTIPCKTFMGLSCTHLGLDPLHEFTACERVTTIVYQT